MDLNRKLKDYIRKHNNVNYHNCVRCAHLIMNVGAKYGTKSIQDQKRKNNKQKYHLYNTDLISKVYLWPLNHAFDTV